MEFPSRKWPRIVFKTVNALVVTVGIIAARLKTILIAAVAAVLFALGSWTVQVRGQSPTAPEIEPAPRTVNLTAEQEFIIREIVMKDLNVPKATPDAPETIGDAVPKNIELHPILPDVASKAQVKSHEFFVKDDKIILVSPSGRLVADVIKKAE